MVCVDARTGKQVWESDKVTYLKNGASIHLTANGDSVLLYTDKGELIRAQLTPAGYKEISRVAVLEPTFPFAGEERRLVSSGVRQPSHLCPQQQRTDLRVLGEAVTASNNGKKMKAKRSSGVRSDLGPAVLVGSAFTTVFAKQCVALSRMQGPLGPELP